MVRCAVILILAVLPLAGCSDRGNDGAPPSPTASATTGDMTNSTGQPIVAMDPPRELFNQSFRYPRLPTDQPFTATFDVDASTLRLGVRMHSYGDCPAYQGRDEPQVTFTSPSGRVVAIDSFGGNRGNQFSGFCQPGQPGQLDLGDAAIQTEAEAGTWTLASEGAFTGDVRITATANPPSDDSAV